MSERPAPTPPGSARDYLVLPRRRRIGWVVLLGCLAALGPLTIDLYLPAFPTLQQDLGTTEGRVQLTLTGTLIGIALGQLVIGPLSDALGRRRPLLAGLALHLAASLGCAAAPGIEVLGALRVLQGVGASAASVVAVAVVRDLFDGPGATRLQSRLVLVIGVAPVLAPSAGVYLLALTSWRGIFLALAALAGVLAAVAAVRLPETLPPGRRRATGARATAGTYRLLLSDRAVLGLVLTAGLTISALLSYVASAPFVLQDVYGLSPQRFALVFAGLGALLVAGTQATGQLATRTTPQRLLGTGLVGALSAALVLLGLVLTDTGALAGVVAPLAVVTFFTGMALPATPSLLLARHGWAAGTAAALLGAAQFGLGAAVLPVVGLAGLRADLSMAVAITAGLAGAAASFALLAGPALTAAPPRPPRTVGPARSGADLGDHPATAR